MYVVSYTKKATDEFLDEIKPKAETTASDHLFSVHGDSERKKLD